MALIRQSGAKMMLVDEGDLEQALLLLLEVEKTVVEGAGAAALAAVLRHPEPFRGKRVGLVLSGGNIDPLLMASVIERGMVRAGRLARIRVEMRDLPGSLSPLSASGQAYRTATAGRDLVFVPYFTVDTERYNTYFRIA